MSQINSKEKQTSREEVSDQQIVDELLDFIAGKRHSGFKVVDREKEKLLFQKVRADNQQALEEIIKIYRWLAEEAASIYYKYRSQRTKRELIIDASFAIGRAAKTYAENYERRDYSFPSYAMWWILRIFGVKTDKSTTPRGGT